MAAFLAVLRRVGGGAHRLARLLLLVTANVCVFAGALLFTEPSGGILPFFAMAAIPLLLFARTNGCWRRWAPRCPRSCSSPARRASRPRSSPSTRGPRRPGTSRPTPRPTFVLAFLVPFFFFRSNLKAEASLQRIGQEKLKRVIDADLIGVVRGRLSGRIEDANDTFLCLLGYTRQDLAAGALDLEDDRAAGLVRAELPGELGATAVYERICRRKDGTTVPVLVGSRGSTARRGDDRRRAADDEVVGFVLDLTAQKHLEAQRALLHDSREALRLRDLFNSIASHELKTPLTALLLNLRLLRERVERGAPGRRRRCAARSSRCESAAARMGELIHALLDVAQIHRGRLTLNVRETDVVEAVRERRQRLRGKRRGGGAHRIAVRADGPVTARLDPLRFDQVVTNLLSNAVKYGAGKPIEVRVSHDLAGDLAHLEVIDGGPGIDPAMTEKIFEPFQRATSMEPIPGLGLGLYVVKMIVEGHGGQIAVDSQLGQGSRFIVDLPCAHA